MPLGKDGKPLYAFAFQGGPDDGATWRAGYTWSLPDEVPPEAGVERGVYRKIAESSLPAEVDSHPNVIRGATYRWEPQP